MQIFLKTKRILDSKEYLNNPKMYRSRLLRDEADRNPRWKCKYGKNRCGRGSSSTSFPRKEFRRSANFTWRPQSAGGQDTRKEERDVRKETGWSRKSRRWEEWSRAVRTHRVSKVASEKLRRKRAAAICAASVYVSPLSRRDSIMPKKVRSLTAMLVRSLYPVYYSRSQGALTRPRWSVRQSLGTFRGKRDQSTESIERKLPKSYLKYIYNSK